MTSSDVMKFETYGFFKGDVIKYSGIPWMIFEIARGYVLMIQLNTKSTNYLLKRLSELDNEINCLKATRVDREINTDELQLRNNETEPEAAVNERRRKMAYELLHFEDDLLWLSNASKRHHFMRKVAEKLKVCIQSVRRFIHDFLQNNLSLAPMACKFYKCGGKGKERKLTARKQGQKGILLTDEVKAQMRNILNRELRNKNSSANKSIINEDLYQSLMNKYYPETYLEDGILKQRIIDEKDRPTRRQFFYYVGKIMDAAKKYEVEHGFKDAVNNIRGLHSDTVADLELIAVGERYEIDETETDITLVSRYDRNQVIGRGILYFAVDVASKAIVGFQLGLDNNSWCGAELVLLNMVEDKVEVCGRAGRYIKEEEWPISGVLPRQILVDNGSEYMSYDFEKFGMENGIEILYAPSRGGSFKGNVEQKFRQFMRANAGKIPGEIRKDAYGQPHLKEACLTIEDLLKIVIEFIIYYNNTPLTTYPWDETVLQSGIEPTPANVWRLKASQANMLRRVQDMDAYKYSLLSKGTASITREGIVFNKVIYTCDAEWLDQKMCNVKQKGREKLEIRYDKRNMECIYFMIDRKIVMGVINPGKTSNRRYAGSCLDEVEATNKIVAESLEKGKETRLQNKFQYDIKRDEIVKDANKAKKGKNETKDRRVHRDLEKEQLHKEAQVVIGASLPSDEVLNIQEPGLGRAPSLELIESPDFELLPTHEKMKLLQKLELELMQGYRK